MAGQRQWSSGASLSASSPAAAPGAGCINKGHEELAVQRAHFPFALGVGALIRLLLGLLGPGVLA